MLFLCFGQVLTTTWVFPTAMTWDVLTHQDITSPPAPPVLHPDLKLFGMAACI